MTKTSGQLQTGSYAVTTVYTMPWTKKVNSNSTTTKKKSDKKVVYEIFEQCSELTTDQYWISIFKACAREKFPRGFQYSNGLLIHRRGTRTTRVEIPNTAAEAYSTAVSFFKSAGGLMSVTDRKRVQKEEEEKILESISSAELKWTDIKIERVKEVLLIDYIADLVRTRNYNNDQKNELTTTIKIGFMLKYFGTKNVIMEQGRIVNIEGLLYDNDNDSYYIDPKLTTKRPTRKVIGLGLEKSKPKEKLTPIILWEKYLENLEKKMSTKQSHFNVINSYSSSDKTSYSDEFASPGYTSSL